MLFDFYLGSFQLLGYFSAHAIYLTFAELGFSGVKSLSRNKIPLKIKKQQKKKNS
jgi:hypothetical protein